MIKNQWDQEILSILCNVRKYMHYFSHKIGTDSGFYYYGQELFRFIILYGYLISKKKKVSFKGLHRNDTRPCTESGLSVPEINKLIKYYPSCTKFEELSQTDEWKLYLHFYGNACRDFKQRYQQALDCSICFPTSQIKQQRLIGIMKCTGYSRLAFDLLKKAHKKVLHISTVLLSDLEYAYTQESVPMRKIERLHCHREIAVFDEREQVYKVIVISRCLKGKGKLEFALDEHQHPFVLKKPFKKNIGRKIFFPMNAGVPFIIHPNGITHTPPKDFSTKERNNFLMSGTLTSDLCPHKYW